MMSHSFINVVIPFEARYSGAVNKVLREELTEPNRGNRPTQEIELILTNIGTVHFMSITVVDPKCPAERNDPTPPVGKSDLVIEISVDGGTEETLTILSDKLQPQLKQIFDAAKIARDDNALGAFLLRHRRLIGASWGSDALGQVFTGSPGMNARRICDEERLAARTGALIEKFGKQSVWHQSSPRQRLDSLRNHLWEEGEWKWAFVAEPAPCLAGDPHNKWDAHFSIFNPQVWKAGLTILNELLRPLYLPFALIVLAALIYSGLEHGLIVGILWTAFVAFCFLVALILLAGAAYLWLRRLEEKDLVEDRTPPSPQVEELMEVENFCAQNHLASVSRLKPGLLRRLTSRLAFIVVGTGRFVGAPGFLGKNGVIHFARWMRLPGTDQLLFLSNYDGTWESYVADFIADAPSGVTGIWSNCVGFPRTHNLFGGGAANRDRLVRWARRQQHATIFWYSAYRNLTAARIRINAAIRQGLASAETDADARDWFCLFGSAPRPPETLQTTQIPTLVFGGLSNMRFAECHVIALGDDKKKCREWLATAATDATYGEMLPGQKSAIVVALSATGLAKLGVPPDAIETFPVAFQQGMWREWRARELGDTGSNAPARWEWGSSNRPADVLILVYGFEEDDLRTAQKRLIDEATKLGHVHSLALTPLPDKVAVATADECGAKLPQFPKEPFGFTDGVSQPVIRGAPRSKTRGAPNDLVAPGEIVLGYPDNLGKIPPSPSIADKSDPDHLLPDAGPNLLRRRPEFSRYEGDGRRDLGLNGTFLVVRQLQQDVKEFEKWLEKAVEKIKEDAIVAADPKRTAIVWGDPAQDVVTANLPPPRKGVLPIDWAKPEVRKMIKDAIAAKLIGRWKDGTSLVRNPLMPGTEQDPSMLPDNDFLPGAEDPSGLSCPFGAHIRRANPRDTRFPGLDEEIATINRHRILRVGRIYGKPDPNDPTKLDPDDPDKGLLFMCLNADIERQFEFIQKTWLLNSNLHGLENELDPIMGHGSRIFTIPTATGGVVLKDLADFVTVKGGGYFFLPGRVVLHYLATESCGGTESA